MKKGLFVLSIFLLLLGNLYADSPAVSTATDTLTIKWAEIVDEDGKPIEHCGVTNEQLQDAIKKLGEQNIAVKLDATRVTTKELGEKCHEANLMTINGQTLPTILGGEMVMADCPKPCGKHDHDKGQQCKLLKVGDKTYQTVPAEIIVMAGCKVLGKPADMKLESFKTLGCAKSCAKTCGREAAAACGSIKKDKK